MPLWTSPRLSQIPFWYWNESCSEHCLTCWNPYIMTFTLKLMAVNLSKKNQQTNEFSNQGSVDESCKISIASKLASILALRLMTIYTWNRVLHYVSHLLPAVKSHSVHFFKTVFATSVAQWLKNRKWKINYTLTVSVEMPFENSVTHSSVVLISIFFEI